MANVTVDENHITIQKIFCIPGPHEIYQQVLFASLNVSLGIIIFLGNALVIAALQKASSLHPPSKFLFSCLASTDLGAGIVLLPLYIAHALSPKHSRLCTYLSMSTWIIGLTFSGVSLLTLTAISVERFLALSLGLRYRQVVTSKRLSGFVVAFWLASSANAMSRLYSELVTITITCIVLLLSVLTSTFCYMIIYLKLRCHQIHLQDQHIYQGQPNGDRIPPNIARYRKSVASAIWVQSTLLACYLPFGIVFALAGITGQLYARTPSISLAMNVTISLVVLNSVLNPFLYCWRIRDVRQEVKCIIRQFCCFFSS